MTEYCFWYQKTGYLVISADDLKDAEGKAKAHLRDGGEMDSEGKWDYTGVVEEFED